MGVKIKIPVPFCLLTGLIKWRCKMSLLVLTLSHLFHLLATVVWVGGIAMTLFVILPGTKTALESAPMVNSVMKEIAKLFTPMANISIPILIGTGIIIFYYDKNFTTYLDLKNRWNIIIVLKHCLVALMIIIHFYRGLMLNQKIEKSSLQLNESRVARLRKFSLDLVKTNFALGILVLLLTGVSISF